MATSDKDEAASHHYLFCENCGRSQVDWSAIVGPEGEVIRLECAKCGGSDWVRGMEAKHV